MMSKHGWIERRVGDRWTTYRVRYWIVDDAGKEVARSKSFTDRACGGKREAERAASLFLARTVTEQSDGSFVAPSELTVQGLIDRWLAVKQTSVRTSSLVNYRSHLKRLSPEVAAMPLQKLKAVHLEVMYSDLASRNVGPAAIVALHRVLSYALNQAVRWDLITRSPARAALSPTRTTPAINHWTADQAAQFLRAEGNDPAWGLIWRLLLSTGMRQGELLALRWSDIDRRRGELTIRRTLTKSSTGGITIGAEPKTIRSARTIPIPGSCVELLRLHQIRQRERQLAAPEWASEFGDLVFTDAAGRFILPQKVRLAASAAMLRAGVPECRPFDFTVCVTRSPPPHCFVGHRSMWSRRSWAIPPRRCSRPTPMRRTPASVPSWPISMPPSTHPSNPMAPLETRQHDGEMTHKNRVNSQDTPNA